LAGTERITGVSYLSKKQETFARINVQAREAPRSEINLTKEDKEFIDDLWYLACLGW